MLWLRKIIPSFSDCFKDSLGTRAYVGLSNGSVFVCALSNYENQAIISKEELERLEFDSKISQEKELLCSAHKYGLKSVANIV